MKRVLVTGATGFVGRHCVAALQARGFEVHAVAHRAAQTPDPGVHWHRADLLAPGGAAQITAAVRASHLLHLAWYAEPGLYQASQENFRWVRASLDLIEAFRAAGGERMVAAGTCAEYDWTYGLCSEERTPLAPRTIYGACKRHLQGLLAAYGAACGISVGWGRLFFLYGPHEHPQRLVASTIRALLRSRPAPCTHGRQLRDFLHVEDAADALSALTDGETEGPVNIGSGEPVSVRDLVQRIAERTGRPDLLQLGARESDPSEPPLVVADTGRLEHEVGWMPSYDLDRGLDQTVNYWKREGPASPGTPCA